MCIRDRHHATEEPEIVNVEHENAHVEDEVQIVGISDETMDDGSMEMCIRDSL